MNIEITNNTLLKQIQEAFNEMYPYLWIDFFYLTSDSITTNLKPERITPETLVKQICTFEDSKIIDIDGNKSVTQLECDFLDMLGLKAKVFRRSGNVWVGTPFTGNWSLKSQNSQGQQIVME